MAQYYTITVDDIGDFTPDGGVPKRAVVRTNLEPGAVVIDTSNNRLHLGATRFDFTDGSRALAMNLLATDATDLNLEPDTLQYWLDLYYNEPQGGHPARQMKVAIGPFPVTADGPLAGLAEHFDTPAISTSWRSAFRDEMVGLRDDTLDGIDGVVDAVAAEADRAEAAADLAVDISNIDTPDALVAALLPGSSGSATSTALNAAIEEQIISVTAALSESASWETNRDALQAAVDVAEAAGGGRVVAKPGVYVVKGVEIGSHVVLDMPGVTLVSPDGQAPGVLASKQYDTTGSVSGTTLTVASTDHIEVGSVVGIQAAGGVNYAQNTTLVLNITSSQTTGLTLTNAQSFPSSGYMVVDDEVIGYTGISAGSLVGVTRGALGTTAVSHSRAGGPIIGMAGRHYAIVTAISGTTLTLDRPAPTPVTGAQVSTGPVGGGIQPGLTVDGNAPAGGATASVHAVSYSLASGVTIDGLTVKNSDQGGLTLSRGSRRNTISNLRLHDCGLPSVSKGGALWLYQACEDNQIVGTTITGKTWVAIYLDDRTTTASEWDGTVNHNNILGVNLNLAPAAAGYPAAVNIVGGSYNKVLGGVFRGVNNGFAIDNGQQSRTHDGVTPVSTGNEIASLWMDVRSSAWLIHGPGNIVHDVMWTDALGNPITDASTVVYNSKMRNGGDLERNVTFGTGTAGAPGLTFRGRTGTGVYSDSANVIGLSAGSVSALRAFATEMRLYTDALVVHNTGYFQRKKSAGPAPAPTADRARDYIVANYAGKLEWKARFPSGYEATIATETGALAVPSYTTANRPTGVASGYMIFDTDLAKPIWNAGSSWVDATGTTV